MHRICFCILMFISHLKNILKIIDFFVSQNAMFRHVVYETTNPEPVKLKKETMKNQDFELTKDIFDAFELSNEEMINVRGGDPDNGDIPTPPPIKI